MLSAYRKAMKSPRIMRLAATAVMLVCVVCGGVARGQAKGPGGEIHVAAAADLQTVLPGLAAEYERTTGVKVVASYGSSGTLATQILNGAPFDLFLAADFVYPEKIVAAGMADTKTPTQYARGTLVLWARKDSPAQPLSVEKMLEPQVKSVAIADDEHAPYGRAAVSALRALKMYDQVKPKLVVAENVAQAGQFAESGNAQAGLISLTLAMSPRFSGEGTYVRVPTLYPAIQQCAVVLANGKQRAAANAFLKWVLSAPVQQELPKLGLGAAQ